MKEDTVEEDRGDVGKFFRLTMDWAGKKERICLFDFWDRYKDKKRRESERERE
jgi:hypothetical protein